MARRPSFAGGISGPRSSKRERGEALTLELRMEQTEYEPEQFSALMYRDLEYVVPVFSSGKLLCTGLIQAVA